MKHVVCYSGGHSSALVAIEVVRRFGKEDVILLNHDISANVESEDVKRFKREVAEYLGLSITYANMDGWEVKDPIAVCLEIGGFKGKNQHVLCTSRLKTEPFQAFLQSRFPGRECIIYYGFDANERHRIQRRSSILAAQGYRTDSPLALWERTIFST